MKGRNTEKVRLTFDQRLVKIDQPCKGLQECKIQMDILYQKNASYEIVKYTMANNKGIFLNGWSGF